MITPDNFKCERCGGCCMYLIVKVTGSEIKKIKEKGFEDFYEYDDNIKSYVIKRDDKCFFLGKDKGYYCKIYGVRPKTCKNYPFSVSKEINSCKPQSFARNLFK